MGRIKELKDKQKAGELTDVEEKELNELLSEASAPKEDAKDNQDSMEKEVEKLSDQLATSVLEKIAPIQELADSLKANKEAEVKVKDSPRFVLDPQMGKVAIDQLEADKVILDDRKAEGKKSFEISRKTIHWVQAIVQGDRQKLQLLTEGAASGAAGGYLVPDDFINLVIEDRRDATVMRQLATVLPVSTDTIHIPNVATRPKAFWRSEGAVKATTTVQFGETVLTPYSLAAIVGLSNELVADAQLGGPIVSLVARFMGQALAEEEDKQFWEGNGSGKPTGVDNYSYTTISGGITDTTRADAITKGLYLLPQGYRNNAVFVANKNTLSKIATLKDNNNQYLLTDLGSDPFPRLKGRPVYEQNDIGDGKAFLGDFSYYYIADRQGITVDTSTEATVASQSAFERNLTYVRVEERVDGELTLTNAVVEFSSLGGL